MSKGKNPFFEEELEEEVVTVPEQKKEMFEDKGNEFVKSEELSERIVILAEPSLKKRLVDYAAEMDVKHAVIVRAALNEYLEKRGR